MVKQPPFRCEKTYFLRDIHIWVAANRPGWTRNNIDNTSETIWFADENQLRQRYRAHMRGARNNAQANLVGTLVVSPQLPYTVADIAFARTNKRLPQPPPAAVAPAVVAAAVAPAALPPPPPPPPKASRMRLKTPAELLLLPPPAEGAVDAAVEAAAVEWSFKGA